MQYHEVHLDERQYVTFSLKGLKTITNNQYEPACGILSLLDIFILILFIVLKTNLRELHFNNIPFAQKNSTKLN